MINTNFVVDFLESTQVRPSWSEVKKNPTKKDKHWLLSNLNGFLILITNYTPPCMLDTTYSLCTYKYNYIAANFMTFAD